MDTQPHNHRFGSKWHVLYLLLLLLDPSVKRICCFDFFFSNNNFPIQESIDFVHKSNDDLTVLAIESIHRLLVFSCFSLAGLCVCVSFSPSLIVNYRAEDFLAAFIVFHSIRIN